MPNSRGVVWAGPAAVPRCLLPLVAALILSWLPGPAAAQCAAGHRDQALAQVHKAGDWEGLHAAYRRYPGCDDGAVAEAYADRVMALLSRHWDSLPRLAVLVAWDEAFAAFVVGHIDAGADPADLTRILTNVRERGCPGLTGRLCDAIRDRAASAREAARAIGAR